MYVSMHSEFLVHIGSEKNVRSRFSFLRQINGTLTP